MAYEPEFVIERIKWKGCEDFENTWKPEENLNCQDFLEKFASEEGEKRVSRDKRTWIGSKKMGGPPAIPAKQMKAKNGFEKDTWRRSWKECPKRTATRWNWSSPEWSACTFRSFDFYESHIINAAKISVQVIQS
ncbi:chromobox protein homolog 3-like [Culex pipiens pallens]|uniref:chromobox protein homolog 3-like n=1 Tax=Culex pipiens pallens TaxID=42434 RepID=UPI001952B85A|nr:chromobox protein homolog 3-like [Culex pipiens pallens]